MSNQELLMVLISIVSLTLISAAVLYHIPVSSILEGFVASSTAFLEKTSSLSSSSDEKPESCKWFNHLESNKAGDVSPSDSNISMFSENDSSSKCCPSAYSTSNGCLCVSKNQMEFLNSRGGNRAGCTEQ